MCPFPIHFDLAVLWYLPTTIALYYIMKTRDRTNGVQARCRKKSRSRMISKKAVFSDRDLGSKSYEILEPRSRKNLDEISSRPVSNKENRQANIKFMPQMGIPEKWVKHACSIRLEPDQPLDLMLRYPYGSGKFQLYDAQWTLRGEQGDTAPEWYKRKENWPMLYVRVNKYL